MTRMPESSRLMPKRVWMRPVTAPAKLRRQTPIVVAASGWTPSDEQHGGDRGAQRDAIRRS